METALSIDEGLKKFFYDPHENILYYHCLLGRSAHKDVVEAIREYKLSPNILYNFMLASVKYDQLRANLKIPDFRIVLAAAKEYNWDRDFVFDEPTDYRFMALCQNVKHPDFKLVMDFYRTKNEDTYCLVIRDGSLESCAVQVKNIIAAENLQREQDMEKNSRPKEVIQAQPKQSEDMLTPVEVIKAQPIKHEGTHMTNLNNEPGAKHNMGTFARIMAIAGNFFEKARTIFRVEQITEEERGADGRLLKVRVTTKTDLTIDGHLSSQYQGPLVFGNLGLEGLEGQDPLTKFADRIDERRKHTTNLPAPSDSYIEDEKQKPSSEPSRQ